MQSKDRALRVTALVHAIDQAGRATANPFITMDQIEQAALELSRMITAVLDSEYARGFEDGANFGANIAADYLEGGIS